MNPLATTGQYQIILPRGRAFSVQLSATLVQGATYLGTISYPVPPIASLTLSGDRNLDFSVQGFLTPVTLSGQVVDSSGQGVNGAIVTANAPTLMGALNIGFTAVTQTDSNGFYHFAIPSGTNYQLVFTPPIPSP